MNGERQTASQRALAAVAVVAALALSLVGAKEAFSTHTAGTAGAELLPDLLPLEPDGFSIQTTTTGQRRLLFNHTVANVHTGPLEVFQDQRQKCTTGKGAEGRRAYQRVYRDANGNGHFDRGSDTGSVLYEAGCMTFHQRHRHMHLDDFNDFLLYGVGEGGVRTGEPLRTATKQSFCLMDIKRSFPDLPGSPASPYYTRCDRNSVQGISVGWSDIYPYDTQGQYVDITGLADGTYCFVVVTDPRGYLRESDDRNNQESVTISISGNGSTVAYTPGSTC